MAIEKTNSIIAGAFLSALLFLQATCNKHGLDCAATKYSFQLPIRAYPNKEWVHVGDTIWLEINESTTLKDNQSGQSINYGGAQNLGSGVSFSALSSNNEFTLNAVDKFEFVLKKGTELRRGFNNGLGNEYRFVEEQDRYLFLLGIVAKEKGIYGIVFSNAANVFRTNDRCTKANFAILFEDTDQHYRLNPFYIPGTNPRGGDYYFKVI